MPLKQVESLIWGLGVALCLLFVAGITLAVGLWGLLAWLML